MGDITKNFDYSEFECPCCHKMEIIKMSVEGKRRLKKRNASEKRKIESMKQQSRELTKIGEIEKATRLFNSAWDLEMANRRRRK
jgi:hypothetical protein